MFEHLKNKFSDIFNRIRGVGFVSEVVNISSNVNEVKKILIQADVNYKLAKQIT